MRGVRSWSTGVGAVSNGDRPGKEQAALMGESELSGSGRALSPRQERIAGRLFRQVGLGSAAFFRDACVLLAEVPPRPTATHLVAHLLREVESSVRSVLEPADAGAEAEGGNHKASIRAVLKVLGISPQDWVAELWLGLTGKGGLRGLAPQAHRSGLEAPRPLTPEFLDFTDRLEQVLDAVLEQFEVGYFEVFERLDALLATTEPTRDDARLLRQNFPRNHAVTQYFFSRASASWVGPLASVGFFDAPPATVVDEESRGAGPAAARPADRVLGVPSRRCRKRRCRRRIGGVRPVVRDWSF